MHFHCVTSDEIRRSGARRASARWFIGNIPITLACLRHRISRNYNLQYDPDHDFLLLIPNPYGPVSLTTALALRL
jgi:hypothetical protein